MTEELPVRRTQVERRALSRSALIEAAAIRLSAAGYAGLVLEQVARDAGYTRGAVYHQFAGKDELALAVVEWVAGLWDAEVGRCGKDQSEPDEALLAVARAHALFCRRPIAQVMLTLRIEFLGQDHPVGTAVADAVGDLETWCAELITQGRATGRIPDGPPAHSTASAFLAVLEAVGIHGGGQPPHDVELAERAARGVLGLPAVTGP
ncbi:TetR/AcrR family transcriptional regulator [Occultella gossypii]|uniref:TetR/AcrR family transcriptional regulator n=1 Tax=Occultella gossypii TaxID=2800820 RepID=A0ABS7SFQ2_9MICO|nr:TetR/AcrR family transcriptional regulator [Occultella gossypii]MBZ2198550.1 TetR/AcrR family transcriptional regulator [Occultella gossypii]